jgi:hypothetical protein
VARIVFVVAHTQPSLHEHLVRMLVGTGIDVVLDRRRRERRRSTGSHRAERRRRDRRRRPYDPAQFYPLGYAVVRAPARRRWLTRLTATG